MRNQYSDSPSALGDGPTLAIDTGSPITSVALGRGGGAIGTREAAGGRSSARLLVLIEELLAEHGFGPGDLGRVIAARGPGSFTGLRVGLATVLGLHQALKIPATAVGSLRTLACSAAAPAAPADTLPLVAVVDALRGEWFAQTFTADGKPVEEASIVAAERLLDHAPCRVTGFGLDRLPPEVADSAEIELVTAGALAPSLLAIAEDPELDWSAARLVEPLYLRPPAAAKA